MAHDSNPESPAFRQGRFNNLRKALAEPASCQGFLDSSLQSIDALIAEIDDLSPIHVNDEYGCKHSEPLIMYHACDIKAILDKYRGVK